MDKSIGIVKKRSVKRAALIKMTAETTGVSPETVKKVLSMDRRNNRVLAVYMELDEGMNLLLQEVKKLLPDLA